MANIIDPKKPLYPEEVLDTRDDDGTMPENVAQLEKIVVGRRIVKAERGKIQSDSWYADKEGLVLTLDDGSQAILRDTDDCCAYTDLEAFFLDPDKVDHIITGVGTTDGYTVWHIYADFGDVMTLNVGWSSGNPFYYGYGFDIEVVTPQSP